MSEVDHAGFWEGRYATGGDGWEIGRPAPPLEAFFRSADAPPPGLALVPGCGRGHEVRLLAELGHDAVGLDFAPAAIAAARAAAAAQPRARFLELDFFALPADREWRGRSTGRCSTGPTGSAVLHRGRPLTRFDRAAGSVQTRADSEWLVVASRTA